MYTYITEYIECYQAFVQYLNIRLRTTCFSGDAFVQYLNIRLRTTCFSGDALVDSRYLEFDGTMEKIRVNRSSTQEELWKYRKHSLQLPTIINYN
jgi:hypothetical protein